MAIGTRITHMRQQAKLTQKGLSEASGLAVSYLSRVENGHVTPSINTLERISEALGTPMTDFFDADAPGDPEDQCPVSVSGRCILDHHFIGRGRKPSLNGGSYTSEQLEVLRLCNYLLQSGDNEIIRALDMLVRALLCHTKTRKNHRTKPAPGRARKK